VKFSLQFVITIKWTFP